MTPDTDGHAPRGDPPDSLALAEKPRDALGDAAAKASRLVSVLRNASKPKKALAARMTNLWQLNLGEEDPR